MTNPWEEISLDDYEKHMSLDSVRQLQAIDAIMKEQFAAYPVETAAVLGVAGGLPPRGISAIYSAFGSSGVPAHRPYKRGREAPAGTASDSESAY